MHVSSETRLSEIIKAHIGVSMYVTHEEPRAIGFIRAVNARLKTPRPIYEWDWVSGLVVTRRDGKREQMKDTGQPDAALAFILKLMADGSKEDHAPGIFVLKDFHHVLRENGDPTVIRLLRNAAELLPATPKSIILLSPVAAVPHDLEKDIVVVDLELPREPELTVALKEVAELAAGSAANTKLTPGLQQACVSAGLGLTRTEFMNAAVVSLARDGQFRAPTIAAEKANIIRKSGCLEFVEPDVRAEDVGGLDILLGWLNKRTRAFSPEAKEFGLDTPKGLLLTGIPGVGKSLMAKVTAAVLDKPLIRMDLARAFGGLVGESEQNVLTAIKVVEAVSPCVLWLDEIEKALGSGDRDGGTTQRVFGMLLTWFSEKTVPAFVVATANNIAGLPPELLRKGRFDEVFFADLPDTAARETIFAIHLRKRKRDPAKFDLKTCAELSDGYSGSEIEQAVVAALYDAFSAGTDVSDEQISMALSATIPLSTTMAEPLTALREWADKHARPASSKAGNMAGRTLTTVSSERLFG